MWGKNSANVTDATAASVHGTNPQNLIEKILRSKIYNHAYWKEHCFGLTAESLVDKAMEMEAIGGTFGGVREPTHFIQLTLKMLQIQPEKEIVVEFIKNEDYKYVRALGAYYMRLTGRPAEVYQYLEPLYNDYRKLRRRMADGSYVITRMDEFIDECLREDYLLDIALPHLPKRLALEASGQISGMRRSALEEELDELEAEEAAVAAAAAAEAAAAAKAARAAERESSAAAKDGGASSSRDGRRRDDDRRQSRGHGDEPARRERDRRGEGRRRHEEQNRGDVSSRHGRRGGRADGRSPSRSDSRAQREDDQRDRRRRAADSGRRGRSPSRSHSRRRRRGRSSSRSSSYSSY
jgi:pre-mRNA-splicing factor 38A